ncbi:uncharacterized protein LOC124420063 isoform X2 [Lucilia cuprina]|uniref:uncharacterized protein LOC124420063 isoform X2 n=1 Tax=Lucilia cuprina TaxID=7375 RepID=UPI001F064229|nr:uncharacterized protein LOC124420063 isoform X2 [Lucilia cuprina]
MFENRKMHCRLTLVMHIHLYSAPVTVIVVHQELENAKLCIVFNIQKLHFQDDITRALKKKDPQGALKCLKHFLDSSNGFNLLKVGGRLEYAAISEGQKHPIILLHTSSAHQLHTSSAHQ